MSGYLEALTYYLRQNMVHQLVTVPKYTSQKSEHHFQDFVDGQEIPNADIFLYNKCSSVGGHRGMACVAISIVDGHGNVLKGGQGQQPKASAKKALVELEPLKVLTDVISEELMLDEDCVILQFRIWEQGRIDLEELVDRLRQVARHALWEVVTEYILLPNDIIENSGGDNEEEILKRDYAEFATQWFDLGLKLRVPSMQMTSMQFHRCRHSPVNTLKELQHQVMLAVPDVKAKSFQLCQMKNDEHYYVPCNRFGNLASSSSIGDNAGEQLKDQFVLVARNFKHWQSCLNHQSVPAEDLAPKSMRPLQKFQPLVVSDDHNNMLGMHSLSIPTTPTHSSGGKTTSDDQQHILSSTPDLSMPDAFIPRQRLLLAHIYRHKVEVYSYNCSRDCVERLAKLVANLGHWFSARASLSGSIVAQKLGLYNNQAFYRTSEPASKQNPFLGNASQVDSLVKNQGPPSTGPVSKGHAISTSPSLSSVYRDAKPLKPLQQSAYSIEKDATGRHGRQMLEIRLADKRDILKKLYMVWQSRGDTTNVYFTEDVMSHLKQISRLAHFCLTPLLFLPKWRYEAHSTRLNLTYNSEEESNSERKASLGEKPLRRSAIDERHHVGVVHNFVQEYIQYLQTHGFMLIQTKAESPNKRSGSSGSSSSFFKSSKTSSQPSLSNVSSSSSLASTAAAQEKNKQEEHLVHLQKSLPGGILMFEIGVCEPFVSTKLYALEYTRLQPKGMAVNRPQVMQTLVEECERVKRYLHMHSFTYDYHLRTISSFVSGKPVMRKGYHLTYFLDDFIKYYSKGPNFGRNTVYPGSVDISCSLVTPTQLYNYMLSHETSYHFKVLRMEPLYIDTTAAQFDLEYVLVRQYQNKLSYSFPGDIRPKTDDFDVTLVICHDHKASVAPDILRLNYYIVLSSKHEMYPTLGNNDKSQEATFKTVSTAMTPSMTSESLKSPPGSPDNNIISISDQDNSSSQSKEVSKPDEAPVNITTESVHYVGYFSTHEQSMQSVMRIQAATTENMLRGILKEATVHCRRDHLWKCLHNVDNITSTTSHSHSSTSGPSYAEFCELLSLVCIEPLDQSSESDVLLSNTNDAWFKGIVKVLTVKHEKHHRIFTSQDGLTQHVVVLSDQYVDMATLLTNKGDRTDISVVLRTDRKKESYNTHITEEEETKRIHQLAEAFIASCCLHLWTRQL